MSALTSLIRLTTTNACEAGSFIIAASDVDPFISHADARIPRSTASPGIKSETVKTPGTERCAELALARHRGEMRATIFTHPWLLSSSGCMRFVLPASWTHSPDSTKTNAIFRRTLKAGCRGSSSSLTIDTNSRFQMFARCGASLSGARTHYSMTVIDGVLCIFAYSA